jgi:glycolate oxidase FAD binding subunit
MVLAERAIVLRGGGTKPALSTPPAGATCMDLSRLTGIIEYEPDEYTFTAYAGTPVSAVAEELARHGQHLPFDPVLMKRGATLGGTIAANTSGSGRYRFGGVRDFILGVRFVDGQGRLVRGGGKVVKNAAGFDLPKFLVGSLGRYGALVEVSFKVFPRPQDYATLQLTYPDLERALHTVFLLATKPFDLETLDLQPNEEGAVSVRARLGGLTDALPGRVERLQSFVEAHARPVSAQVLDTESEAAHWAAANELAWVPADAQLLKVPIAPKQLAALDDRVRAVARRYTAGGNVAWLAVSDPEPIAAVLTELGLVGLRLFGPPGNPYVGVRKGLSLMQRVKRALDPSGKFLEA